MFLLLHLLNVRKTKRWFLWHNGVFLPSAANVDGTEHFKNAQKVTKQISGYFENNQLFNVCSVLLLILFSTVISNITFSTTTFSP